jgi:hypothetical protein
VLSSAFFLFPSVKRIERTVHLEFELLAKQIFGKYSKKNSANSPNIPDGIQCDKMRLADTA